MKIKIVINGKSVEVEIDKEKFDYIYLEKGCLIKHIQEIIKSLKQE